MTYQLDTLVIGAGQAGLAAGYHLQRAGHTFALLEAAAAAGGSWPHYYDSLRLFSPARFAALPGLPFPGDPHRYPARDDVVAYLRQYAAHFQLPITCNARVTHATRTPEGFIVQTDDGRVFRARSLIAATGAFHRPALPTLPGQATFRGTLLHASAYRAPAPWQGQRVVVVGAGNSAVQIAVELAQVAQVTLASHAPVRFVRQRPFGQDIHVWLCLTGLDRSPYNTPLGAWVLRLVQRAGTLVLDTGAYAAALAAGRPDRRAMFTALTPHGVIWPDGQHEAVDTVIFATGYRPNLDYLAPLGALDASGQALQRHGLSLTVPGLGFVGLDQQRTYASATLRGVGPDAAVVVRHLTRTFRSPARSAWWDRLRRCCAAPSAHT